MSNKLQQVERLLTTPGRVLLTGEHGEAIALPDGLRSNFAREVTCLLLASEKDLLTLQQVAELLDCQEVTVRQLIERRQLVAVETDSDVHVAASEVDKYKSRIGRQRREFLDQFSKSLDDDGLYFVDAPTIVETR